MGEERVRKSGRIDMRRKRRVQALAFALALAAVIQVSVAWGLTWRSYASTPGITNIPGVPAFLTIEPARNVSGWQRGAFGVYWLELKADPNAGLVSNAAAVWPRELPHWIPARALADGRDHIFLAAGWPMRMLKWEGIDYGTAFEIHGGFTTGRAELRWESMDGTLPISPIWSGVLLNVGMTACVLAFLFLWFVESVQARRRGKGACTTCGYSLAGTTTATCPECGADRA